MEAPGIEPLEKGLETRVSAGFPHVTVEPNVQTSTPNCAEGRALGDSRTNRQEGPARMMANLSSDLHAALEAGDLEAARVANEAMTRLLGGAGQPSAGWSTTKACGRDQAGDKWLHTRLQTNQRVPTQKRPVTLDSSLQGCKTGRRCRNSSN